MNETSIQGAELHQYEATQSESDSEWEDFSENGNSAKVAIVLCPFEEFLKEDIHNKI